MAIDPRIRDSTDERNALSDVKRLAAALPPGTRKARVTIHCKDCGRKWQRKLLMSDAKAPEAFHDLVREGQMHGALHGHRDVQMTVETL